MNIINKETEEIVTKICNKCQIEKTLDCFHKCKGKLLGVQPKCKDCTIEYQKERKLFYIEFASKTSPPNEKACSKCGKIKLINEFSKRSDSLIGYNTVCKECDNQRYNEYRRNNYDKIIERERKKAKDPQIVAKRRERVRKRRERIDIRISNNFSTGMRQSLHSNKKGRSWETLVNYTIYDLKLHLESLFTQGMTWENYGQGPNEWQIDHIIPVSKFYYEDTNDPQFKACWVLSNLQPLWGEDNRKKYNNLNYVVPKTPPWLR